MKLVHLLINCALVSVIIGLIVSCCTVNIGRISKLVPEYTGVDPKAAEIVDEFLSLAKINGVVFTDKVTVGFKNIAQDSSSHRVLGLTSYGRNFREIDLDILFWENYTKMGRTMTLFHELGHAYCGRRHDFGNGTMYYEGDDESKIRDQKEGFYDDGCPKSIMAPFTFTDDCALAHYSELCKELLSRCEPY
jgi:hypothetical protein